MKKIQKITSFLLTAVIICSIMAIAPFSTGAVETLYYNGFTASPIDSNKAKITGYSAGEANVTIPSSIKGYTVTEIGFQAFQDNKSMKSVTVPNSVKKISAFAFENCSNLTTVKLGTGITTIEGGVFWYCTSLTNISIPSGVTKIEGDTFSNCTSLKSVSIPANVTEIGERAFSNCKSIENAIIPDKVKKIGIGSFYNCKNLKSIQLSNSLTDIGFETFSSCEKLESLKIPGTVKKIGLSLCCYCTSLKTVEIGDGTTTIDSYAFNTCTSLTKITIPETVTKIGTSYYGKSSLKETTVFEKNSSNLTIYGQSGSFAEMFAKQNDIKFSAIAPNPDSVKVNRSTLTLGVGESYGIIKTVSPANASQICTWSSSNSSVASVDGNGRVTAKTTGTANITVKTSNGKTASCKVTVKPAPVSVKISNTSLTLGKGETFIVSESTNSGSYAWGFSWSSSNISVAAIEKTTGNKAKITAINNGTATITIKTYNGKTATCKVTVKSAPASVTTKPANLTLGKGETYTIAELTNSGSYANAANLKWSSTNSSVATVTKGSGNKATITAKGIGTAYVKITLYNGKTAQCKVTVKNAPSSVSISKTSLTLKKGQTYTVAELTNSGSYANAANLKWSSTNSSVAAVAKGSSNKAVITAKSKGTAYIKITLYNGKTAQCKVTVK